MRRITADTIKQGRRLAAMDDDGLIEIRKLLRSCEVPENLRKLKRIARRGGREVQFALGLRLLWDIGAVRSGLYWIRCAANQNHVGAQYLLASGFATGFDFRKDLAESVYWYRRAARLGHSEAQYNLALMYAHGEGVSKNLRACRRWLERAGRGGDLLAIELLMEANACGRLGYRVDKRSAAFWARVRQTTISAQSESE